MDLLFQLRKPRHDLETALSLVYNKKKKTTIRPSGHFVVCLDKQNYFLNAVAQDFSKGEKDFLKLLTST